MESAAAIVTALGGLSGLAALINVIRGVKPTPDDKEPDAPHLANDPDPVPPYSVSDPASQSLGLGMIACLLAAALVIIVHAATTLTLDGIPIVSLEWSIVVLAALAILFGVRSLRPPIKYQRSSLMLRAGAGLVAACGALIATLIAGTT